MSNSGKIQNVLIVGLGLIGGSLALAIKRNFPEVVITGLNRTAASLDEGLALGIIDQKALSLTEAAPLADVIFFCTPVKTTLRMFEELVRLPLKDSVILTDAGSTKSEIVSAALPLKQKGWAFIGGHPMAGSHKSGVTAANVDLFESAYYLFTPSEPDNPKEQMATKTLQHLLAGTRAKFLTLTPTEHDEVTGMLSHLPHVIASALVMQADHFNKEHTTAKRLAAGGFRDITRIASSDPAMWTDILLSNQKVLLKRIAEWQSEMDTVKEWIASSDQAAIYTFFEQAKEVRDHLPVHKEGAMPAFYDLFVDIPDYPGIIAEVTGLLAQEEISLINVKILETREDVYGVLQLTFKSHKELLKGKACIEGRTHYLCHEK